MIEDSLFDESMDENNMPDVNTSAPKESDSIPNTIAIDGPAASGKSTLGKRVADKLGYLFFDTGVMYRAITWVALQKQVDLEDESRVTHLAQHTALDIQSPSRDDGRQCDILADGVDITWEIRTPEVDRNVSLVSSYAGVREALTLQQRKIGERGQVVMMGRDIGTVVLPDADLKIYLDASAEVRAQRRHAEILKRGEKSDQDQVLEGMHKRDRFDSTRKIAPLKPAEDAIIINSDNLNEEQVLLQVLFLITQRSRHQE